MGARYAQLVEPAHLQPNTDGERDQNRAFEFAALVFFTGRRDVETSNPSFCSIDCA
jgi:hypothetical protein